MFFCVTISCKVRRTKFQDKHSKEQQSNGFFPLLKDKHYFSLINTKKIQPQCDLKEDERCNVNTIINDEDLKNILGIEFVDDYKEIGLWAKE